MTPAQALIGMRALVRLAETTRGQVITLLEREITDQTVRLENLKIQLEIMHIIQHASEILNKEAPQTPNQESNNQ